MRRCRFVRYLVLFLACAGLIFLNQEMVCSAGNDSYRQLHKADDRNLQMKNHENSIYQWVRNFNDPLLDAVVTEVLKNNYDINKAIARLTKAQGVVAKARAGLKPLLNLRAGALYLADVTSSDFDKLVNSASADFHWDIDIWKEGQFELESQKARLIASEADSFFIKNYIVAQTVRSWILAIETKLQLELAARLLEDYRNILKIVKLKYDQGFVQKQDISTAKAKLAEAEEAYFQLQGAHIEALRSIELLLGRNPEGNIVISQDLPELPNLPVNLSVSDIMENRDDVLTAKYRFDAESLNLKRAKRSSYPNLKLTSSLIKSSPELNTLTNSDKAFTASGVTVEVPIVDGGRSKADILISAAEKDEAFIEYQQKNKGAFSEIETALMNGRILEARKEYLEVAFQENTQVQELAKKQYDLGEVDMLTVFYHTLQTGETKAKLLHLKAAQLIQRADLYYSLGRKK